MEQDIKDIELFIDFCRAPYNFEHESEEKSYKELSDKIENLIKAYKELEEKNKKNLIEIICYQEELENNIPISLVEEKIKEYTKLLKNCNRFSDVDRIKAINERILAYKELLERRK